MQRAIRAGFADFNSLEQSRVLAKLTGLDGVLDLGVILIHHAAGADTHVADFGIAHLPRRQAHHFFRSVDEGVRMRFPQEIPVRFARLADGVVVAFLAITEAIENNQ